MRYYWFIGGESFHHPPPAMTFTTLDQVKLRKNVATVPADSQGRQFFAFGTGAPQRAMTEQELISWANGNYHIR
jgi:hypothetical protein